ncbi:MAG: ATP-binding protein [Leeuwenhoekiella sp.]
MSGNTKRILLIGGPSTGKTTLLEALKEDGYVCYEEISREVTRAAQEQGIDQLFLTDPLLFSQKLLEGRIAQFENATEENSELVFIDRGIPDVLAYMDYVNQDYPENFGQACQDYRYDLVFALPPWREIHQTDQERYESFDQAIAIQQQLIKTYEHFSYHPIMVPKTSVASRKDFILQHI